MSLMLPSARLGSPSRRNIGHPNRRCSSARTVASIAARLRLCNRVRAVAGLAWPSRSSSAITPRIVTIPSITHGTPGTGGCPVYASSAAGGIDRLRCAAAWPRALAADRMAPGSPAIHGSRGSRDRARRRARQGGAFGRVASQAGALLRCDRGCDHLRGLGAVAHPARRDLSTGPVGQQRAPLSDHAPAATFDVIRWPSVPHTRFRPQLRLPPPRWMGERHVD
jgi:hypothetical protein